MARSKPEPAKPTGKMRLSEPFRITVMLDDDIQFRVHDIQDALAEDFPDLDWSGADALPDLPFDTGGVAAVPVACGKGIGPGVIMGGGAPHLDWSPLLRRNRIAEDGEVAARMMDSAAHLEISVGCVGTSLTRRVEAARRATAIAAIFAELPIATGVAVGWCDRLMPAPDFARAAVAVRAGRIPMLHWLHLVPFRDPAAPDLKCGVSVGLAPFFGVEIEARQSPESQAETLGVIYTAATNLLEQGHAFVDGGEMVAAVGEGQAPVTYRIRHLPEGKLGNDTDRWLILHPDSPFRARKLLGRAKAAVQDAPEAGWLSKGVSGLRRATASLT